MKIIKVVFVLAFLTSCNFNKTSEEKAMLDVESLNAKEQEFSNVQNNQGELIGTIEFGIHANKDEVQDFEDGIIPWISIEKTKDEINRLIDADKVVITYSEIILIIDYPLNKPVEFIIKSSGKGFTKKQLVLEISKKYHEIYKVEESSAKTKTIPIEKREGIINRNETDGTYGIWGHDIGDLVLSSAEVYKMEDVKIQVLLGIES
ncbi:hypothetical protein [Flavobacterium sp.]|uniref:hypothetical protein n=1 Tax=Flavobacterium sp. TaxID=239 RepID=UPI0026090743|nr:hypothetical protein [Flavobacterium sp.]